MMELVFDGVDDLVGKKKNVGSKHFLLFQQVLTIRSIMGMYFCKMLLRSSLVQRRWDVHLTEIMLKAT